MTTSSSVSSWAVVSGDGVYRYRLGRNWGDGPTDVWIMLNPSTADATRDDPTIRRCIGFSKRWGAGGLVVVNLYALRSTDPAALLTHPDPVGPDNDETLVMAGAHAELTGGRAIAAWGTHPATAHRAVAAYALAGPLWCLGTTRSGAPRHPLYVPAVTQPVPWTPPTEEP